MCRLTPIAIALAFISACTNADPGLPPDAGRQEDAINNHLQQDAQDDAAPPVTDGPPPATELLLYAHTDTKLYKADPTVQPLALNLVGTFDCIGGTGQDSSMTDIAIDKDGKLFAVSNTAAYALEVTGSTVHCKDKWTLPSGGHFYGLTFAPAGVLGPNEMLVGANSAGELWAISSAGATTQVGTFGKVPANDGHGHPYDSGNVGKDWELSGDIVFLTNSGSPVGFATVRDCPTPPYSSNCNPVDTLVEINVPALALGNTSSVTKKVRGQIVKASGCNDTSAATGYGSMYGIAAWNDKVFGFSRAGYLVEISNVDGTACMVADYSPGDKFAGAGVSTVAPVIVID
ncbi:MAG TPA: hypothetical protein VGQ83_19635 [Polyangia bacterium]|jgi:hypothetical protein